MLRRIVVRFTLHPRQVLGLDPGFTPQQLKARYLQLAKLYHPDISEHSSDEFLKVKEAYEILSDKDKLKQFETEQKTKKDPVNWDLTRRTWQKKQNFYHKQTQFSGFTSDSKFKKEANWTVFSWSINLAEKKTQIGNLRPGLIIVFMLGFGMMAVVLQIGLSRLFGQKTLMRDQEGRLYEVQTANKDKHSHLKQVQD